MATTALIFGMDDLYETLKPFYNREVQRGNLDIAGYAYFENGQIHSFANAQSEDDKGTREFQVAIISSHENFYTRVRQLEEIGIPRKNIVDGRTFMVNGFDFPRLIKEGIAYGALNKNLFTDMSHSIHRRIFSDGTTTVNLGAKSYVVSSVIHGSGEINIGNFCSIAQNTFFNIEKTLDHNYRSISSYALFRAAWEVPQEFFLPSGVAKINIGADVWIGRNCTLKSLKPDKPLIISDGAVIAADSVVVKNVPPYAIVGGNPAQIIKYRFPPHVIEALLRIKWWDWSLDKIHDNFKYFNDIEKFISLHDK